MLAELGPHSAAMHPELPRQRVHTDTVGAGCSHSVHFLSCEPSSRSFRWFRGRADQRVVGLAIGLGVPTNALIPRGNKPLNPWSPVPVVLHCAHQKIAVQTLDVLGLSPAFRSVLFATEGKGMNFGVEEHVEWRSGLTVEIVFAGEGDLLEAGSSGARQVSFNDRPCISSRR